jgi:hypothetical protein
MTYNVEVSGHPPPATLDAIAAGGAELPGHAPPAGWRSGARLLHDAADPARRVRGPVVVTIVR